jgi:Icc-related predicted phosphoesterase
MTRIVCTADLHENLIDIPECDLLLIAGDISFAFKGDLDTQDAFLAGDFKRWLDRVPAAEVVLVAGNHDQSIEARGLPAGLRCHYLEDAGTEHFGLKIWGTPWQPWFHDWAFNAPRRHGERFLAAKFEQIPADTDIVVCHGPPRGYGDFNAGADGQPNVGSTALTEAIEHIQPSLVVCGHIHSGHGRYRLGATEIINAALVDNEYRLVNELIEITL